MKFKLLLSKAGMMLHQSGPELLTGGGIILGIAAVITACSKMKKAEEVKDIYEEEIQEVRENEEADSKEYALGCVKVWVKTAFRYLGVFWLPILLEILSIAGIWYAHGMMVKRNAALTSATVLLTRQIENYRGRVREKLGEEAENDLYYGITNKKVDEMIVDEDGKAKKVKGAKKVLPENLDSPFDRVFGIGNSSFNDRHPGANIAFLTSQRNSLESLMKRRATDNSNGWVTINEAFSLLGFEPTELGFDYGWIFSYYDERFNQTTIDFGLNDFSSKTYQDFINGLTPAIALHFNCQPLNRSDLKLKLI